MNAWKNAIAFKLPMFTETGDIEKIKTTNIKTMLGFVKISKRNLLFALHKFSLTWDISSSERKF